MATDSTAARAALAYAAKYVGVRRQATIEAWRELAGLRRPQPWGGCFVNACLVAAGIPSGAPWIASAARIAERARAGAAGWSWHGAADGRPGDLALYVDGPDDAVAVHVEIVRARLSATRYSTYGGDTTPGGRAGGGMVARHDDRSTVGAFRIAGFARPRWTP